MENRCASWEAWRTALPRINPKLSEVASSATSSQIPTPRSMDPSPRGIAVSNRAKATPWTEAEAQGSVVVETARPLPNEATATSTNKVLAARAAVVVQRDPSLVSVDLEASTPDARKGLNLDALFRLGPTSTPPSQHPQPPLSDLPAASPPQTVEPPQTILDTSPTT